MFVSKKKYNALKKEKERIAKVKFVIERDLGFHLEEITILRHENARLKTACNHLNQEIDSLCSQGRGMNNSGQFTQDEIKKLISLCHPDKHGGKAMATEITAKLNKMRR